MQNSCTRKELMSSPEMKDRYQAEYPAYQPELETTEALRPLMKDKRVTIVLGTWCSDSQLQVPRFYKVLDEAGVDESAISLICVNENKEAENGLIDNLDIAHVPTFIFTANNIEIGRITESPESTLENDMVIILANK